MQTDLQQLKLVDFDFHLPEELIAQIPTAKREQSRLMKVNRREKTLDHGVFADLPNLLNPTDLLVINDSKVIPARARGHKASSTGAVEILLLSETAPNNWWVMLKPGKRVRPGTQVELSTPEGAASGVYFEVTTKNEEGHCHVRFFGTDNILETLEDLGEIPLPPYIAPANTRSFDDKTRYQTVYAAHQGSVAAPTAGLHFSTDLMSELEAKGVEFAKVTLHVGYGTFAPVKATSVAEHQMHRESFEITKQAAEQLNRALREGRRIIPVGTTSLRVIESAVKSGPEPFVPQKDSTEIFIYPPFKFRVASGLITNFHLPKSTLLMLVSAMASPGDHDGIELIRRAYAEAIAQRYRFFSYGDAMFIQ